MIRALIIATAVALGASPGETQTKPAPLRTEVMTVTPPAGWVMSVWRGGTFELAEFTPPGQTGGRHVDLLGYSVSPKLKGVTATTAVELPKYSRREKSCRIEIVREQQIQAGWYAQQTLCIGPKGTDPSQLVVQFDVQRVGEQAVFRVWREFRGTSEELSSMLQARTRQALAPVDSRGRVDPAVLDQSFVALAPVLMPDLQRAEICDLRHPTTCSGFRGELPSEATARLRGKFIAGFYGKGMGLITRAEFRRRFGAEGGDDELCRVFAIVEPRDLDWSDEGAVNNVVITVGTGIVTDGGSLVASDPTGEMSPDRRAQVRAQVLMAGRRLWREGYPPDIIAFRIPPSD